MRNPKLNGEVAFRHPLLNGKAFVFETNYIGSIPVGCSVLADRYSVLWGISLMVKRRFYTALTEVRFLYPLFTKIGPLS